MPFVASSAQPLTGIKGLVLFALCASFAYCTNSAPRQNPDSPNTHQLAQKAAEQAIAAHIDTLLHTSFTTIQNFHLILIQLDSISSTGEIARKAVHERIWQHYYNAPIDSLIQFAHQKAFSTHQRIMAHKTSIDHLVRQNHWNRLSNELKYGLQEFPSWRQAFEPYLQQNWHIVDSVMHELELIKKQTLAHDQRLYAQSKAVSALVYHTDYFSNSCYDFTPINKYLKQIYERYPESTLAETAYFEHLGNSYCFEGSSPPYGDPAYVADWQKFINQYPLSKLRRHAICRMIEGFGTSEKEAEKALYLFEEVELYDEALLKADQYGESYTWLKEEFESILASHQIKFTIQPSKSKYKIGEPIEIKFSLHNLRGKTKKIAMLPNQQGAHIAVSVVPAFDPKPGSTPLEFVAIAPLDDINHDSQSVKQIEVNTSHTETWDILKRVHKIQHPPAIGRYVFLEPGKFNITAKYYDSGQKNSGHGLEIEAETIIVIE